LFIHTNVCFFAVYQLISRRRFQQIDVLEGQNILVTISGKKNKIRVYYLSWLKGKILKTEGVRNLFVVVTHFLDIAIISYRVTLDCHWTYCMKVTTPLYRGMFIDAVYCVSVETQQSFCQPSSFCQLVTVDLTSVIDDVLMSLMMCNGFWLFN